MLPGLLLYGAGLRLRVKDIDFARRQIMVRDPKGKRDRATMLPVAAVEALHEQLEQSRALHDEDLSAGFGWVWLPDAIGRKFPNAHREWIWQWYFRRALVGSMRGAGRSGGITCMRAPFSGRCAVRR